MSIKHLPNALKTKGKLTAVAATAFMFVASFAAVALPGTAQAVSQQPASKEACKNGGWEALGYKNQGQCIKAAVAAPGNGYGGNGGNNTNVNVGDITVIGDGNSVNIIVNVITG